MQQKRVATAFTGLSAAPKAAWIPARNTITVRYGMDDAETLCALAHELGHAHYNDPAGHYGAHELRASRFPAKRLISPAEYALAEKSTAPPLNDSPRNSE